MPNVPLGQLLIAVANPTEVGTLIRNTGLRPVLVFMAGRNGGQISHMHDVYAANEVAPHNPAAYPRGASEQLGIRPSVLWFAGQMEKALRQHDGEKSGQAAWRTIGSLSCSKTSSTR